VASPRWGARSVGVGRVGGGWWGRGLGLGFGCSSWEEGGRDRERGGRGREGKRRLGAGREEAGDAERD